MLTMFLMVMSCYAQNSKVDSLIQVLPDLPHDESRVNTLNYLALRLSANNTGLARELSEEAIFLAQRLDFQKGLARAYNARAVVKRMSGQYDAALEDFVLALNINQALQDTIGIGQTLNGIGALYMLTEDFAHALEHFKQGFELRKATSDTLGMAVALSNIGNAYEKLGDLNRALEYHKQSIKYDLAKGNEFSSSYSLHSMGLIFEKKGQLVKAEENLRKALRLREAGKHDFGIAETSLALGRLLFNMDNLLGAKKLLNQSEEISKKLDVPKMRLESVFYLAEIHQKDGNTQIASELFREYAVQKDSVFSLEKNQQFEQLRIRYELDKREQENELLKKDKLLQREQLDKQGIRIWFLASGIAFITLLLLGVYKSYSNKQKTNAILLKLNGELKMQQEEILAQTDRLQEANTEISRMNKNLEFLVEKRTEELQQTNEELEFYLYHSAHDLRRPITSIRGLVNIAKLIIKDKEAHELFGKIDLTARNMLKMIQKLNMLTEINHHLTKVESLNFRELLEDILIEYKTSCQERQVKWVFQIEEALLLTSDYLLCRVVIKNLIENAVLFSDKPKSTISITAKIKQGKFYFSIHDQGCGISEEHLPAVYDLYFRATEKSMGNGIGLYLVKKCIEKLNGFIHIESEPQQGTKVKVVF